MAGCAGTGRRMEPGAALRETEILMPLVRRRGWIELKMLALRGERVVKIPEPGHRR
jgi:hypothetical protein